MYLLICMIIYDCSNSDEEAKDNWSQNTDTQFGDRTNEDSSPIKAVKNER